MTPSWNLSALFGPIARPLAGFNFNFKWKDSKGRKQGGYTLNVDADEEEFMENVFDALCAALSEPEIKKLFLDAEGIDLMVLTLK